MFSYTYNRVLVALVMVAAIGALGAYTFLTLKESRYLMAGPAIISVTGTGEVLARPDIATFSFSVVAEGDDAASAQDQSAQAINEILLYLQEQGIAENDIKTDYYNLNPRYEYVQGVCDRSGFCPPGERVLRGYEVNQTVSVKVREIDNAGELISGVGTRGATNVSSLSFTIDDEDSLKEEARAEAIEDAREKAQALAAELGVRLVRITNYWEDQGGYEQMMYRSEAMGLGGAEDAAVAPSVPTGENTVMSRVNLSYEVR